MTLTECEAFFRTPAQPRHRLYEALRAYFLERRRSKDVARAFGYTVGSFRVLCHQFRHARLPEFFCRPRPGPRQQPKKNSARQIMVQLRKRNYSVYDISQALKDRQIRLSATAVREVLKEEGFAPLPRRLDEERPAVPRATPEPTALPSPRTPSRPIVAGCSSLWPIWCVWIWNGWRGPPICPVPR